MVTSKLQVLENNNFLKVVIMFFSYAMKKKIVLSERRLHYYLYAFYGVFLNLRYMSPFPQSPYIYYNGIYFPDVSKYFDIDYDFEKLCILNNNIDDSYIRKIALRLDFSDMPKDTVGLVTAIFDLYGNKTDEELVERFISSGSGFFRTVEEHINPLADFETMDSVIKEFRKGDYAFWCSRMQESSYIMPDWAILKDFFNDVSNNYKTIILCVKQ